MLCKKKKKSKQEADIDETQKEIDDRWNLLQKQLDEKNKGKKKK